MFAAFCSWDCVEYSRPTSTANPTVITNTSKKNATKMSVAPLWRCGPGPLANLVLGLGCDMLFLWTGIGVSVLLAAVTGQVGLTLARCVSRDYRLFCRKLNRLWGAVAFQSCVFAAGWLYRRTPPGLCQWNWSIRRGATGVAAA